MRPDEIAAHQLDEALAHSDRGRGFGEDQEAVARRGRRLPIGTGSVMS